MKTKLKTRTQSSRRPEAASVSMTVLMIMTGMAMITLAMASATTTQVRTARAGQDALITQTVAEAGVDDAIDRLTMDRTITGAGAITGQICEDGASPCTRVLGNYSVDVADVTGGYGKRRLTSRATTPGGATRTVVALLTQGDLQLGKAAMMSNGTIKLGGNANIHTKHLTPADAGMHVSDIFANGDVTLGGSGSVDGRLISASTVTGTAFYPSISNAPPYPFPTSFEQTQMQNKWIAQSQAAVSTQVAGVSVAPTVYNGSTLNGSIVTITAPAYIVGDVQVKSGQTLIIKNDVRDVAGKAIVYITGNLKMTASAVITNSSTLVVGGNFNQTGQAYYGIVTPPTALPLDPLTNLPPVDPTTNLPLKPLEPSLTVANGDIGLQGGGGNYEVGAVYALRGSISLTGNTAFTGSLVAGGTNAQINALGTYDQYFPADRASAISLPSKPLVTQVMEL